MITEDIMVEDEEFEGEDEDDEREYSFGLEEDDDDRSMFADPGGRSALRAATPENPRNLPCPQCEEENRLTPADVALGYVCDVCADQAEGRYGEE